MISFEYHEQVIRIPGIITCKQLETTQLVHIQSLFLARIVLLQQLSM